MPSEAKIQAKKCIEQNYKIQSKELGIKQSKFSPRIQTNLENCIKEEEVNNVIN